MNIRNRTRPECYPIVIIYTSQTHDYGRFEKGFRVLHRTLVSTWKWIQKNSINEKDSKKRIRIELDATKADIKGITA